MRGHARAAAVLTIAAVVCLILPAASVAAQQPRHVDYSRLPTTDEAVRQAGQDLLEQGSLALTGVLDDKDQPTALEHANETRRIGQRLALAGALAARTDTSLPELLADLGPASGRLGESLWNLTNASATLLLADPDPVTAYLAHRTVDQGLEQARTALATYDREDLDTGPLRALLDRLDAEVGDPLIPPGSTALLDPARVTYGQRFDVLVLDADQPGAPVEIQGPAGLQAQATLDSDGFAATRLQAPWAADPGTHPLTVTAGDRELTLNLTLRQLTPRFEQLRADPPGDHRNLSLHLVTLEDQPVTAAPVTATWTPADQAANQTGNRTGDQTANRALTVTTDAQGRAQLALAPGLETLTLTYPGNRTHQAASTTWQDPWAQAAAPTQPTEADRIRQLFEQIGAAGRPSAPILDTTLLTLVAGAMLIAVALELEHIVFLDRRWHAASATGDQRGRSGIPSAALPEDHPLLEVLKAEGLPAASLTLREAAVALDRLGAPHVFAWARRHERAFYRDQALPPVPAELVVWVEARLGRPVDGRVTTAAGPGTSTTSQARRGEGS